MELLDGKKTSQDIQIELAELAKQKVSNGGKSPHLAAVLVGDNGASLTYVNAKVKACDRVGFKSSLVRLSEQISEKDLLNEIYKLNNNEDVDGFIVQLPLPDHIDETKITLAIDPAKDADGFHAINVGRNSIGGDLLKKTFTPCTPLGCYLMLKRHISDLKGMHAVIIGRSNIVGKPMAQLLLEESCTVSIVHSKTKNIEEMTRQGDIVVAAVGRPLMVKKDWIKPGAVVIDVGINRIDDPETGKTKLVGDVDYNGVAEVASAITPVPGGVGPMTIACLLKNTVDAANRQAE